jgi:hypothetical protein
MRLLSEIGGEYRVGVGRQAGLRLGDGQIAPGSGGWGWLSLAEGRCSGTAKAAEQHERST